MLPIKNFKTGLMFKNSLNKGKKKESKQNWEFE